MPIFRDSSSTNRTAENGLLGGEGDFVPAFLWRASSQSGFWEGIRRMQCDQKTGLVHSELTFVGIMETGLGTSRKPFLANR
jgi:hypothetical protein